MRRVPTPVRSRLAPVLLPAAAVTALLPLLAACSGSSDDAADAASTSSSASASASTSAPASSSPSSSSSSTGSASPSATASASPAGTGSTPAGTPSQLPTVRRDATNLHLAILQSSVATTAEEKAVVTAWMGYWRAATDSTYLGREVPKLATFSAGQARSSIQTLLRQNKAAGQRGVGWAKDNVTRVTVSGDSATIRDCTRNFTFNVDEEGTPATKPFPWYDVSGRLEKRDGSWIVVHSASPGRKTSCLG